MFSITTVAPPFMKGFAPMTEIYSLPGELWKNEMFAIAEDAEGASLKEQYFACLTVPADKILR